MSQLMTVESVAEILTVHTRTVRRYIKEGSLKAQKVGGQWRISAADLKEFMGISSFDEITSVNITDPDKEMYFHNGQKRITISSVVDVRIETREEALRISSSILAAMNNRDREDPARCDYLFLEKEGIARFILSGSPEFMASMISMFDVLAKE